MKVPAYGTGADNLEGWRKNLWRGEQYVVAYQFFAVLFGFLAISLFVFSASLLILIFMWLIRLVVILGVY